MGNIKVKNKCPSCGSKDVGIYRSESLLFRIQCGFCNAETTSEKLATARKNWKEGRVSIFMRIQDEE